MIPVNLIHPSCRWGIWTISAFRIVLKAHHNGEEAIPQAKGAGEKVDIDFMAKGEK